MNFFRRSAPATTVQLRPASTAHDGAPERKQAHALTRLFSTVLPAEGGSGTLDWARRSRAYRDNAIVHRCVRLVSEACASVPLLAYEGERELSGHPLLALLDRPNPSQGRTALVEAIVCHQLLAGRACLERVDVDGEPRELHLLQPDSVETVADRAGWPTAIIHQAGTRKRRHEIEADGDCRIAVLATFDPLAGSEGAADMAAAWEAVLTHRAASRWSRALLENSARPSGALVYRSEAGNLTDEQFERLRTELEDGYSGAARAGRPLLLEGGLDWKAMGYSPRDMDFAETRHAAARDIALAFGVPPMLLGIPGDNTYANLREANRAFARHTVVPLMVRLADALTHWLAPRYRGDGLRLTFDLDRLEGLSEDRDRVWRRLAEAPFLSDAEKRVALGYSPEPEGS